MNLKKIVAAGIAAVCAVSMAACGGSGDSSKVTDMQYKDIKLGETGKDIKANLKLFSHRTDMLKKDYPGTTWDQYIAEFNKMYPNIKVTVEANSDYANSAMTRLQGGDWGDIMMIPAVDRAELQNYFISYGSLGDMDKEVKYAVNQSYQKKVYGVASVGNASGIVYNKKVFKDAGIDSLPTTPDEFISDLKAVKNKTQAIPLYTNYAAGWTMGAWDAYIGGTATGDPDYMNNVFTHSKNPFKDPGDGTHSYNVYKILYDAVADGLTEDDYSTTDWESSKNKLNAGEIATMARLLGRLPDPGRWRQRRGRRLHAVPDFRQGQAVCHFRSGLCLRHQQELFHYRSGSGYDLRQVDDREVQFRIQRGRHLDCGRRRQAPRPLQRLQERQAHPRQSSA